MKVKRLDVYDMFVRNPLLLCPDLVVRCDT